MGVEPIAPTLQGSVAPSGMQARWTSAGFTPADVRYRRWCGGPRSEVRPGIEPEPRPYQGRVLPKHLQTAVSVIPGGIEPPISWVSSRRLCRWTTGPEKFEVRRVKREHSNFTLPTSPFFSSGSGSRTPAIQAYEARMSTGPPASCRSRYRTGHTGRMKASWVPAHLQSFCQ